MIPWVVRAAHGFLNTLGYQSCKIAIKSDNEASIIAIRNALTRGREAATVPINVPVRKSKSNGAMERAIRTWQGMMRTIKCSVERQAKAPLPILHPIVEWAGTWACTRPLPTRLYA